MPELTKESVQILDQRSLDTSRLTALRPLPAEAISEVPDPSNDPTYAHVKIFSQRDKSVIRSPERVIICCKQSVMEVF